MTYTATWRWTCTFPDVSSSARDSSWHEPTRSRTREETRKRRRCTISIRNGSSSSWGTRWTQYTGDTRSSSSGEVTTDGDGCPCFDGVTLIPRKHVIPEYRRVITDLGQDWTTGIEYRKPPFTEWLIEAGSPDNLGLFLKAATQTIPKKNALAFWDTFAEIFGMPMRIAKTTTKGREGAGKDGENDGQHGSQPMGEYSSRERTSRWSRARGATLSMSMTNA